MSTSNKTNYQLFTVFSIQELILTLFCRRMYLFQSYRDTGETDLPPTDSLPKMTQSAKKA